MGETVTADSSGEISAALTFYFDHNMPGPLVKGLRQQGIDVLTAIEDGYSRAEDRAMIERATSLNRILVTQDQDFLALAADLQAAGRSFSGVIHCRMSSISTSQLLDHLEMAAKILTRDEMASSVLRIPLSAHR